MVSYSQAKICMGCWEQMRVPVPLRGLASIPFRFFGIRPSRMNPNTCRICELMFTRVMKARTIKVDVSVLFADIRGYTSISRNSASDGVSEMLDVFYDECAAAIWENDGLLNKTSGDGIMAIFNFPIPRANHPERAVLAARSIQRRCQSQLLDAEGAGHGRIPLQVGVGIDSGEITFGEFGRSLRDLTAVGTVVNTAARAQSVAGAGQILVTKAVRDRAPSQVTGSDGRLHHLKGLDDAVELYAI